MKILVLILFILCVNLLIYLFLNIFIKEAHKKLFNYHFNINPLIDSYKASDYDLDLIKYSVNENNETINGYFYTPKNYDKNKLIIFCHGMWGTKETYLQDIGELTLNNFQVLSFDCLGFGESDGKILGLGTFLKSLDLVLNDLMKKKEYIYKDIYVIGHSMGGYAATNIVKYHPEVKAVIGLAPLTSVTNSIKLLKLPLFFGKIFTLYDERYFHSYSLADSVKSLKNYKGKVLIIQSTDDNMVPFKYGLQRIKDNLKDNTNIEYLEVSSRHHNPEYTIEAVENLNAFLAKDRLIKNKEDRLKLYQETDFKKCGTIDKEIFQVIIDFINNN